LYKIKHEKTGVDPSEIQQHGEKEEVERIEEIKDEI